MTTRVVRRKYRSGEEGSSTGFSVCMEAGLARHGTVRYLCSAMEYIGDAGAWVEIVRFWGMEVRMWALCAISTAQMKGQ